MHLLVSANSSACILCWVLSFGSAAKGTGLKALEFAFAICDTADMYGFAIRSGKSISRRPFYSSKVVHGIVMFSFKLSFSSQDKVFFRVEKGTYSTAW